MTGPLHSSGPSAVELYLRTGKKLDNSPISGYSACSHSIKAQQYVLPAPRKKVLLKSARTYREDPADIFLPQGHGFKAISVRMTSLGNSIGAMSIPFSKLKIPRAGGNRISIELRNFGGGFDKQRDYGLRSAATVTKLFKTHPDRGGVIMIQGLTYAPIEVEVYGYSYVPMATME